MNCDGNRNIKKKKKPTSAHIFCDPPNLFRQPWKEQIEATKREKKKHISFPPECKCSLKADACSLV